MDWTIISIRATRRLCLMCGYRRNSLLFFQRKNAECCMLTFAWAIAVWSLAFAPESCVRALAKSRSRIVHCANCPQLCTGTKYLPYWSKLLESQKERIHALVVGYRDVGFEDYEDFIKYQQEQRLQSAYENIVAELRKSEVGKS